LRWVRLPLRQSGRYGPRPRAPAAGVDPLGYYLPPYSYAEMQILAQAVNAVGSLD